MNKVKLSLIGMPGVGKTTVGKLLSEELKISFFDTDYLIEKKASKSVSEIFATLGEIHFRLLEKEIIKDLYATSDKCVISLGGGAVIDQENRELIKSCSTVIWLVAPVETLYKRILTQQNSRPLLDKDAKKQLEKLLAKRLELYKSVSDFEILTDKAPQEIVSEIKDLLTNFWK